MTHSLNVLPSVSQRLTTEIDTRHHANHALSRIGGTKRDTTYTSGPLCSTIIPYNSVGYVFTEDFQLEADPLHFCSNQLGFNTMCSLWVSLFIAQ